MLSKSCAQRLDLALSAMKATTQAIGKTMASLVVLERHLWLKRAEIRDTEKMAQCQVSKSGKCQKVSSWVLKIYSTRLLTSVCSQATSFQNYYSHFSSGQRTRSPTRSANTACKRCYRNSASSKQLIRLLQPLLPLPQKRWQAETNSRS